MLQATAAAMVQTNFDMSADLIWGGPQQDVPSLRPDNIGCERVFGFKDWRFHVAKMELGLRTDGIIMTRMNGTTAWVEKMVEDVGEEEFDKWFNIVTSTAYTRATENEYKRVHREANERCKQRRREKLATKQDAKDEEEMLLTLHGEEEYSAENLVANFDDLARSGLTKPEKVEKVKRQWQRLKAIAGHSKIPARQQGWPGQPSGNSLPVWQEAFAKLLGDTRLRTILEKGRTNLAKDNSQVAIALGAVLGAIPAVEGISEDCLLGYKRRCEEPTNKSIHRSKKHRDQCAREAGGVFAKGKGKGKQAKVVSAAEPKKRRRKSKDVASGGAET